MLGHCHFGGASHEAQKPLLIRHGRDRSDHVGLSRSRSAACNLSVSVGSESSGGDARLTARMQNVDGDAIGTVLMEQSPTRGFLVTVMLEGLEPGFHGIHIHTIGSCSPDFKASGGHINVHDKQHGLLNPEGPDNGDLPNIYVAPDGTAQAEMFTTLVDADMLMDDDGSAIVVHENRDDHITQPIGGAGGRVACGVLSAG